MFVIYNFLEFYIILEDNVEFIVVNFYFVMFREDEIIENWEFFNEFKDLYMVLLNLYLLLEGLYI